MFAAFSFFMKQAMCVFCRDLWRSYLNSVWT